MKYIYTLLILSLFSCNPIHTQEKENFTFLFSDVSGSVKQEASVKEKNEQALIALLSKHVVYKGDIVSLSYIHGNTSQKGNQIDFEFTPKTYQKSGQSNLSEKKARESIAHHNIKYRNSYASTIKKKCFEVETNHLETSIYGAFVVMQDRLKEIEATNVNAYLFTDLKQCDKVKKLFCVGSKNPKSYDEAIAIAKEDLPQIMKHYHLSETSLSKLDSLVVILPASLNETDPAYSVLPVFFRYLMEHLGAKNIYFK